MDSEIFEALTVGGNGEEFSEVDLLSVEGADALLVGGNVEELSDGGFLGVEDEICVALLVGDSGEEHGE